MRWSLRSVAFGTFANALSVGANTVSLVEPESSDGPAYVKSFYAAQIPEYESAISLLEHYLKAPDNAALAAFAGEQLPLLRAQAKDAERTMADIGLVCSATPMAVTGAPLAAALIIVATSA